MGDKLFLANPMSRATIRQVANSIRKRFGFQDELKFPLIDFVEFILFIIDPKFDLEILSEKEMPQCYAQAIPEEHKIILREDVYYGVIKGNPRSRFTLAHEVGHYILHTRDNIIILNRSDVNYKIPKYKDPEWQANTFAGELLVPYGKILDLIPKEISELCGVSHQVAEIQLNVNKKGS